MTLASVNGANGNQIVVNGLVSGINTTAVIQALLQGYQAPITNTEEQQATETAQADDYRALNNDFQAVQTAAEALSTQSSWNLATATTSNADVATATAAAGAQTGSLAFTVNQLAQANVLASSSGVSSEGQIVDDVAVPAGGDRRGRPGFQRPERRPRAFDRLAHGHRDPGIGRGHRHRPDGPGHIDGRSWPGRTTPSTSQSTARPTR